MAASTLKIGFFEMPTLTVTAWLVFQNQTTYFFLWFARFPAKVANFWIKFVDRLPSSQMHNYIQGQF